MLFNNYFFIIILILSSSSFFGMNNVDIKADKLTKHQNGIYSREIYITNREQPDKVERAEDLSKPRKKPITVLLHESNKLKSERAFHKTWETLSAIKLGRDLLPVLTGWLVKQALSIDNLELRMSVILASLIPAGMSLFGLAILEEDEAVKEKTMEFGLLKEPVEINPGQTKLVTIFFDPTDTATLPIKLKINDQDIELDANDFKNSDNS